MQPTSNSHELPIIWQELLNLATRVGEVKGQIGSATQRIERLENRLLHQPAPVPSPPSTAPSRMDRLKARIQEWSEWASPVSLFGKIGLWLLPRVLLAWGIASGWSQTLLAWLQRIIDFL